MKKKLNSLVFVLVFILVFSLVPVNGIFALSESNPAAYMEQAYVVSVNQNIDTYSFDLNNGDKQIVYGFDKNNNPVCIKMELTPIRSSSHGGSGASFATVTISKSGGGIHAEFDITIKEGRIESVGEYYISVITGTYQNTSFVHASSSATLAFDVTRFGVFSNRCWLKATMSGALVNTTSMGF